MYSPAPASEHSRELPSELDANMAHMLYNRGGVITMPYLLATWSPFQSCPGPMSFCAVPVGIARLLTQGQIKQTGRSVFTQGQINQTGRSVVTPFLWFQRARRPGSGRP